MGIKIIHIISSLSRGGRERQLATLVSSTNQQKYPTKIIYFNKKTISYIDEYGLQDTAIQIKEKGKLKRLVELHKILKSEKPDIVYTWGNGESVSILLLKPFHSFKFINGSVRHGIRAKSFSHYYRTLILHLSPNIVANSRAGLKANNLRKGNVIYNGIENKFFEPIPNRSTCRKELIGIPESTPVLISVANLVPYKDYFSILEALKLIKEKGLNFHYIILGEGPMRKEIQSKINSYNLTDNTRILGNVENVADYLKVSDIFIHSSKGEGCSNAILEAMAAGLPIIASRTGGTSEIVKDHYGSLFRYQDYRKLFEIIELFIKDSSLRKKFSEESRLTAEKKFSLQAMMNEYYNVLNKILPQ